MLDDRLLYRSKDKEEDTHEGTDKVIFICRGFKGVLEEIKPNNATSVFAYQI
jgi:hypothetical protein